MTTSSVLIEGTEVVVLAGGRGTRLQPYTNTLPKPLMPVGPYPILEILLRQLRRQGFCRATLAVGHLAAQIEEYFRDGSRWDLHIAYSHETTPLGTAGPLANLPPSGKTLLVLNGDLLTTLDFAALVAHHLACKATATIGTKRRTETVDFGIVDTDAAGGIIRYREKPSLNYLVSMGIYAFSPEVLDYIPAGGKLDFPDLVQRLLSAGRAVSSYETGAYWMDIGRPADYQQANDDFPGMEAALLGAGIESAAARAAAMGKP